MPASMSRFLPTLRGAACLSLGLGLVACASGPDPILTTGGKVPPTIENSLRCPSGTGIVFGRVAGVQTAAWCERPAAAGGAAGAGVRHGPYVEWYDTLQKKITGLHEEGLRQGAWRFYMPSGVLDSEIVYDHGNVVSTTSAPTPAYLPPPSPPSSAAPSSAAPSPSVAPAAAPSAAPPVAPSAAPSPSAPVR